MRPWVNSPTVSAQSQTRLPWHRSSTLLFHHVAPVTRRVTDGQEDRSVFLTGPLERLISPEKPVHGMVCVKLEVGVLLVNQAIDVHELAGGLLRGHPLRKEPGWDSPSFAVSSGHLARMASTVPAQSGLVNMSPSEAQDVGAVQRRWRSFFARESSCCSSGAPAWRHLSADISVSIQLGSNVG